MKGLTLGELKPSLKLQRSHGSASVAIKHGPNGNRLEDLFQQGCAKIRLPQVHHGEHVEAVMINTSGGVTGGDALSWHFRADENAALTVTSQACERVYRSSSGTADIAVELEAKENATLFWLPQETMLFDGSSAHRQINIDMAGSARVLVVEPLLFGRREMGETLSDIFFHDQWEVSQNGKIVHREASRFEGDMRDIASSHAVLNGYLAAASVLLLAPASAGDLETKLEKVCSHCSATSGASLWQVGETGKLLARLVAQDGYELRKTLIPIIEVLSDDAVLPKTWSQ